MYLFFKSVYEYLSQTGYVLRERLESVTVFLLDLTLALHCNFLCVYV